MKNSSAGEGSIAKDRKDFVEISEAKARPGRSANELERVPENRPAKIGGHVAPLAGPEIKAFERLSAKDQHDRQQNKQDGKPERDPRGGALAQDERAEPERAPGHEDEDAGPREIENDRGDDDAECQQPDDPAFPAVPDVVLAARQDHDRGQTQKIGRLIRLGKARIPAGCAERKSGLGVIEGETKRGEEDNAGSEKSKLLAHLAQLEVERADIVEPAQAGEEADKTSERNPGLRRKRPGQGYAEIVRQHGSPGRPQKPAFGQKSRGRARNDREQNYIQDPSERTPGGVGQQDQAEQGNDDSFAPFLGRTAEETGEDRERRDGKVPPPPGGSGGKT